MRIAETHSHLNGVEWLCSHHVGIWREIHEAVSAAEAPRGKLLLAGSAITEQLQNRGWREHRNGCWTKGAADDLVPPDSEDHVCSSDVLHGQLAVLPECEASVATARIAIELQFGPAQPTAHDLFVKHLAFYVGDTIDLGIEILPMKQMQAEMSSGPGYYEGALYDLVRQGRGVPAVPLILIGVVP